jgi:hypothetical protein
MCQPLLPYLRKLSFFSHFSAGRSAITYHHWRAQTLCSKYLLAWIHKNPYRTRHQSLRLAFHRLLGLDARARAHLDARTGREVTLAVTGGRRVAEDFAKAMALGADAVAVSNSAMQAVGCIAARMCNSNNCPVCVATQKPLLRKRLDVQVGVERLARYFGASVELMQVLARACGHGTLSGLTPRDISTWKREVAGLSGIRFAGVR